MPNRIFRRSLPIALVALSACFYSAALASPAKAAKQAPAVPFYVSVTLRPDAKWDSKAYDFAQVVSEKDGVVLLLLDSSQSLERQFEKLEKASAASSVKAIRPTLPTDIKSRKVSEIESTLKDYKEAWEVYEEHGGASFAEVNPLGQKNSPFTKRKIQDYPGVDFLQAYLQWKQIRAYPYDDIDHDAYVKAFQQKASALQLAGNSSGATVASRGGIGALSVGIGTGGDTINGTGLWEYIGPRNLDVPYQVYYGQRSSAGRVNAIAYTITPNTYYIGSPSGGVHKTTDGGKTWIPLSDAWPTMGVSSLAVSPISANIVLAGTGDFPGFNTAGFGIQRSINGGQTWTNVAGGLTGSHPVSAIVFDPDTTTVLNASAYGGTLIRSTDSGQTWTSSGVAGQNFTSMSIGAKRGNGTRTLWAAGNNSILISNDRGQTWSVDGSFPVGGAKNIAASKVNPDVAFVLCTQAQKIYKTTDAGATWTDITGSFPSGGGNYNWSQAWYDYYIGTTSYVDASSNNIDFVVIGLIDVVTSKDGGTTWRNSGGAGWTATYDGTAITHNDQHCFAYNAANPKEFLVGNDGGVYKATYDPTADTLTWDTSLNTKLYITQFYTMDAHPTNRNYVFGGTQDNATPTTLNDYMNWENVVGGDGAGSVINPVNPFNQYGQVYYDATARTTTGWVSSDDITPDLTGQLRVPFIGYLWMDPNNPNYVYGNTEYLNRFDASAGGGFGDWTLALGGSALSPTSTVTSVAVAPGNSNEIVAGTGDGRVWLSTDFGATFHRIDQQGGGSGLPNRGVTSINFVGLSQKDVLVTLSGSGTGHVYRCTDITAGTPAWTNLSGSGLTQIPNISANTLVTDFDSPSTKWFVGTDVGIYYTADGGATYHDMTAYGTFPSVQVNWMVKKKGTRCFYAGTFGRGIWRLRADGLPISLVAVKPNTMVGPATGLGTVVMDFPMPPKGIVVNLSSSNPTVVQVPASVTIPMDATQATFNVTTTAVSSDTPVTITASYGTSVTSTTVVVKAANDFYASAVTYDNATVIGGILDYTRVADNVRLIWRPTDLTNLTSAANFTSEPVGNVSPAKLTIQAKLSSTGRTAVTGNFKLWNNYTSKWDLIGTTALGADKTVTYSVTTGASAYVSSTGAVKCRIEGVSNTATTFPWNTGVDQLVFRVN